MRKSQPSVTYVYRGLSRDVPWQLLMRQISESAGCDAPLALVINCSVSRDNRAFEYQDGGVLQRSGKWLTIVDVARLAGVSSMTVSRVLNNRDGVNPQLRARVRAVVEAVGFSLNEAARDLALGRG